MLREVAKFLVGNLVFASLLAVGLQTRFSDIIDAVRNPRLLRRALLVIEIVIPLLAILMVKLVATEPVPAGVVLLFSICPGVALLPFVVKMKGGRVPTALGLLLILTAIAPVTVPVWLSILNRIFSVQFVADPGVLVAKLVPTVLIPLAIGLAVRHFLPAAGDRIARWVNWFMIAAIAVAVVVVIAVGGKMLGQIEPLGALGMFVIVGVSMLLGHWAGGPTFVDRKAVAMAAALGNPALVLLIVKQSYPELEVNALVMAYVLIRVVMMLPYNIWAKRKGKKIDQLTHTTRMDPGSALPRPV